MTSETQIAAVPPRVLLELRGPIAVIEMNRPANYNAIDVAMGQALVDAMHAIEDDAHVRVIVLRGAGKGFCSGGDLSFIGTQGADLRAGVDALLDVGNAFVLALRRSPRLVVASVHGVVAGGGLSLAMACDFCIAAETAEFVPAYARLGVSPDIGGTVNLARVIGARHALRVFLAEPRLTAAQAERLGMLTRVVAPEQLAAATETFALELAAIAPAAAAATKALLREAADRGFEAQLDAERAAFQASVHGPAAQSALRRFLKHDA